MIKMLDLIGWYLLMVVYITCVYNRESTENKAVYFSSADDLVEKLNDSSIDLASNASAMSEIADRRYRWETIARQYESLF